jgi:hypothetical protein
VLDREIIHILLIIEHNDDALHENSFRWLRKELRSLDSRKVFDRPVWGRKIMTVFGNLS